MRFTILPAKKCKNPKSFWIVDALLNKRLMKVSSKKLAETICQDFNTRNTFKF